MAEMTKEEVRAAKAGTYDQHVTLTWSSYPVEGSVLDVVVGRLIDPGSDAPREMALRAVLRIPAQRRQEKAVFRASDALTDSELTQLENCLAKLQAHGLNQAGYE